MSSSCRRLSSRAWKLTFQKSLGARTRSGSVSEKTVLALIFSRWEIFHRKSSWIHTGLFLSYYLSTSQPLCRSSGHTRSEAVWSARSAAWLAGSAVPARGLSKVENSRFEAPSPFSQSYRCFPCWHAFRVDKGGGKGERSLHASTPHTLNSGPFNLSQQTLKIYHASMIDDCLS